MADPTAFYEPEEDELLSSLAVPQYQQGGQEYAEDEYRRMQALEQHAYEQHNGPSEQDQQAALEMVPKDVQRVSHTPMCGSAGELTPSSSSSSFTRPSRRTTSRA